MTPSPETAREAAERIAREVLARTDLPTALAALRLCRERMETKR